MCECIYKYEYWWLIWIKINGEYKVDVQSQYYCSVAISRYSLYSSATYFSDHGFTVVNNAYDDYPQSESNVSDLVSEYQQCQEASNEVQDGGEGEGEVVEENYTESSNT